MKFLTQALLHATFESLYSIPKSSVSFSINKHFKKTNKLTEKTDLGTTKHYRLDSTAKKTQKMERAHCSENN